MGSEFCIRDSGPEADAAAPAGPAAPTESPRPVKAAAAPEPPPIDLLELAGGGALKKYGPAVLGALALGVLVFVVVRLRR